MDTVIKLFLVIMFLLIPSWCRAEEGNSIKEAIVLKYQDSYQNSIGMEQQYLIKALGVFSKDWEYKEISKQEQEGKIYHKVEINKLPSGEITTIYFDITDIFAHIQNNSPKENNPNVINSDFSGGDGASTQNAIIIKNTTLKDSITKALLYLQKKFKTNTQECRPKEVSPVDVGQKRYIKWVVELMPSQETKTLYFDITDASTN